MKIIPVHPGVRGLIFDFDGTLADTMPVHYKAWRKVINDKGYDYPQALFMKFAGMATGKIFESLNDMGYSFNVDEMVRLKNEEYLRISTDMELIEPVIDVVRRYHGRLPVSIGTGEYADIARYNIKAAGLLEYFEIIVSADDITHPKPDPETFLKCAELMEVEPRYCQVFEDSEFGLQAAREAGMIPFDVRPYHRRQG